MMDICREIDSTTFLNWIKIWKEVKKTLAVSRILSHFDGAEKKRCRK
jgi:hypothetical protein